MKTFAETKELESNSSTFQIVYTGAALSQGTMPIATFVPALLALDRLVQEINDYVNGDDTTATLEVESINRGSLVIDFRLVVSNKKKVAKEKRKAQTTTESVGFDTLLDRTEKILSILVNGPATLLLVMSLLGDKPAAKVEHTIDGKVVVYNQTNNFIITDKNTYSLAANPKLLELAGKVVQPIREQGIDSVFFQAKSSGIFTKPIVKGDLLSFPINAEQGAVEEEIKMLNAIKNFDSLSKRAIVNVEVKPQQLVRKQEVVPVYFEGVFKISNVPLDNLTKTGKWYFSGSKKFSATIQDEDFLRRLRNREITVGANDELEIVVRSKGTRRVYEIIKVIQYRPGGMIALGH